MGRDGAVAEHGGEALQLVARALHGVVRDIAQGLQTLRRLQQRLQPRQEAAVVPERQVLVVEPDGTAATAAAAGVASTAALGTDAAAAGAHVRSGIVCHEQHPRQQRRRGRGRGGRRCS